MKFAECRYLILTSLYRYEGCITFKSFLKQIFRGEGFKYIFWMRVCAWLHSKKVTRYSLFLISKIILNHYKYKFGIDIPYKTKISEGFFIAHFSGVIVHEACVIGKNCNLSQNTTLGRTNRGTLKGSPTIGDNVYIAPGVKIIGNVNVGNNVAVGANAVVTKNIDNNAVAVGIPARVVSLDGSIGYINKTDYYKVIKN